MAKMIIKKDGLSLHMGDYEVDTDRQFGGYESGDIILYGKPFFGVPLTLEVAIRKNGDIIFRRWSWSDKGNSYFHWQEDTAQKIIPTQEQIDTVSGLFSGRILFDGKLKLAIGASVQNICPIDVKKEEQLLGKKIFTM